MRKMEEERTLYNYNEFTPPILYAIFNNLGTPTSPQFCIVPTPTPTSIDRHHHALLKGYMPP